MTKLSGTIGISPRRKKDNWYKRKEMEITTRTYHTHINNYLILNIQKRIIHVKPSVLVNEILFPQTTTGY